MENTRAQSFGPRSYEDFRPMTEWISDDSSQTLCIRLPGFTKEHLKVQMDNFGNLRAVGERPLDADGRRWSRFQTEHPIPKSCDVKGVRARFVNNILYITFPKLITEPEPMPEPEEKKPPVPEQKQEPETQKKEKQEVNDKEQKEEEEKEKEAGHEAVEAQSPEEPAPPPEKMRIGFLKGMRRPSQVFVNMFVAVTVLMAIGIYLSYKLSSRGWGEWGKRRIVQYWRGDL